MFTGVVESESERNKGKATKARLRLQSASDTDSGDDTWPRTACRRPVGKGGPGERWLQYIVCHKRAHHACTMGGVTTMKTLKCECGSASPETKRKLNWSFKILNGYENIGRNCFSHLRKIVEPEDTE